MISVKNVYKDFGSLRVLKSVSCEVKSGEKVAIIGPSGSGKSTLLRCMNLLEEPTFGEIWLDNRLLTNADPYLHPEIIKVSATYAKLFKQEPDEAKVIDRIKKEDLLKKREGKAYKEALGSIEKQNQIDINLARQQMGMVFQHFNLFNNMTVLQNLTLAPVQLKLKTKEEAEATAMKLLARIGLNLRD